MFKFSVLICENRTLKETDKMIFFKINDYCTRINRIPRKIRQTISKIGQITAQNK